MSEFKTLTIQIPVKDWYHLEAEAEKFQTTPEEIATRLIVNNLPRPERRMSPQEALEGLRKLGQDLPPVDTVKLVRECREELEQRGLV